jgi:hypothetical protein
MKTKKYCVLATMVSCLVAFSSHAGPAAANVDQLQLNLFGTSTLKGAKAVYPQVMLEVIEKDSNEISSLSSVGPLERDDLRKIVDELLRKAQIEIAESYDHESPDGPLNLNVAVLVKLSGPERQRSYAAFVSIEALQLVKLARDDKINTLARTWPIIPMGMESRCLLVVDSQALEQAVKRQVTRQVGRFINDYLAARTKDVSEDTERRYGVDSIPLHLKTWMMCRNPDCEHKRQMPLREYYMALEAYVKEHPDSITALATPGLPCEKCGKDSAYKAVKCARCALVFEVGWKRGDFEDRCPKCGRSQIEQDRRAAQQRRQKQK